MLLDIRSSLPTFCGIFGQIILRLSIVEHQENSTDKSKLSAVGLDSRSSLPKFCSTFSQTVLRKKLTKHWTYQEMEALQNSQQDSCEDKSHWTSENHFRSFSAKVLKIHLGQVGWYTIPSFLTPPRRERNPVARVSEIMDIC